LKVVQSAGLSCMVSGGVFGGVVGQQMPFWLTVR